MLRGSGFTALAAGLCQKFPDYLVMIAFHKLAARLKLAS
jgi:hypothetical protein